MKRMHLIGIVLCMFLIFGGCADTKNQKKYEEAVATLAQSQLLLDGSNEMNGEVLAALESASFQEPKNIIFMIGDGMGYGIIEAAQAAYGDQLWEGTLAMNHMPVVSSHITYSASDAITDSAAGGTALATGYKTSNSTISMNWKATESYQTTLEVAAALGKSTGIIATKAVTDATPASFTSHVGGRSLQEEIAGIQLQKMMDGELDLILGGGRMYYEAAENADLLSESQKKGVTYTTDWQETVSASLPLIGLYGEEELDTEAEEIPYLANMTAKALELLSEDEDGFFLMVEGSQIDSYGHNNNLEEELEELYAFDCAVAVAMRYVALHPDTVLIVTADHETGGMQLPKDLSKENLSEIYYTKADHSSRSVPVYAVGYRTAELAGRINENADIAAFVASLLGEESFGYQSVIHSLKGEEGLSGTELDLTCYAETVSQITYAKVLHVTVTNQTDERLLAPVATFWNGEWPSPSEPHKNYLEPKETVTIHYVIPDRYWKKGKLSNVDHITFEIEGTAENYRFSDFRITERETGK